MNKTVSDIISYSILILIPPTMVYLLFNGYPFVSVFMIVYQAVLFVGAVVLILDAIKKQTK